MKLLLNQSCSAKIIFDYDKGAGDVKTGTPDVSNDLDRRPYKNQHVDSNNSTICAHVAVSVWSKYNL